MLQTFGELIYRGLLFGAPRQRLLGALAISYVELNANRIEKSACIVADA